MKVTLKAARVNCGLKQQEAAKRLNISRSTLMSWESGTTFPSVEKADKLCALYGVSRDDVIFLPKNHGLSVEKR